MWRGNDDGIWEYSAVVAVNAYFVKPLIETSVTPAAWRRQAQPDTMFDSLLLHFLSLINWCMINADFQYYLVCTAQFPTWCNKAKDVVYPEHVELFTCFHLESHNSPFLLCPLLHQNRSTPWLFLLSWQHLISSTKYMSKLKAIILTAESLRSHQRRRTGLIHFTEVYQIKGNNSTWGGTKIFFCRYFNFKKFNYQSKPFLLKCNWQTLCHCCYIHPGWPTLLVLLCCLAPLLLLVNNMSCKI